MALHLLGSELLVHPLKDRPPAPGRFPYSFKKCCGSFKVPCIGLVEVGRLGQQREVPIQGQRIAQTRDVRPFSLMAPGSDPQPGIEPRPHWCEGNKLPVGQLNTHEHSWLNFLSYFSLTIAAHFLFNFYLPSPASCEL